MDRRDARILLQQGLPLIVGLSLGGIALVADRILLQAMAGSAIVGFYSAGWLITANSIQLLASGIGSATYPLAVKAFESGNTENAKQQLTSNMIILVGVLLPAGVGLACIAPNLAYLVVGASFVDPVSRLTPWLAASAVVGGVRSNYFDHAFHLTRKTHRLIAVMVTLASTNIVLNLLWIPAYGIVGAGAASLASASIALVHAIVSGLACYRLPVPLWPLSKIALSAGLMAITLDLLPMDPGPATLAIQLGVGVAVYSGALFVLNVGNLREILTTRRMR
jgi:O-antigen/teichoic acid export membrane protein